MEGRLRTVRSRQSSSLVILALVAATSSLVLPAHAQDFDPRGRHHGPPARPHPPSGGPARGPAHGPSNGGHAAASSSSSSSGSASGATNDTAETGANKTVLLERYFRIVLAQPGAPFPLQRLAQLYRERDGNLVKLLADLQAKVAAASTPKDQYPPTVALAGLAKIDGRADDAVQLYQKAIALSPSDASAIEALGHLLADRGDAPGATEQFSRALALSKGTQDREQLLRTLMGLALDQKDWDAAKTDHRELVKLSPTSLFVKGELGHELFTRGEFQRAEEELATLVASAQGDNRALAPALRDLGRAQAKAGETEPALATLKRALQAAGGESSVRGEVYETIAEIYRADGRLPVLIKELEDQHPGDYARLALLGNLYEETGDAAGALRSYSRALAVNPRQIDLRLKMVHLLQSQGELDKAITEYEALVRSAPQNPQFVFEECDALLQRGDRARALALLTALEARAGSDDDVLGRLAEFYARIGETDRSTHVLQRLAAVAPNDPSHLVDLGDRYFQDGNTALATSTWKRILVTVTPRARALAALGDVYLDHDMTAEALAVLKEAAELDPSNAVYKRQLASALERSHDYAGARAEWQKLWARGKSTNDHTLLRESRSRIVALWGLEHQLEPQVAPLNASFQRVPPDLEAGRMLAEVSLRLRKLGDAEATLRRVLELDPGDVDSYLALERALVQDGKQEEAIAVLEKLIVADPKRARELYQRMATYALQSLKPADAVRYAARAVELNPEDAEGHRHLGEMYRQQQDNARAVLEFRAAITKNERLYPVYFELADLLLAEGQGAREIDEADSLFRKVLRSAPDEELVARAARASIQINLGRGQLETLEGDLLPLTIAHPDRPIYRRLLVEIYGNLTYPLVQRVRSGSAAGPNGQPSDDAIKARAELAKVGGRAVKPLLDALSDPDIGQQKVAIDVLSYIENKNAGPALFSYATQPQSQAPLSLRTRAMIACGALRDDALLPRYSAVLFPKAKDEGVPTDAVATAAAWGVAKLEDTKALPLERKLLTQGTPEMRAFAALGIAAARDKAATGDLVALAKAADAGNVARAAAAYALGELNAEGATPTLLLLAQGSDALPRETALLALSHLTKASGTATSGADDAAIAAMATALFAESEGAGPHGQKTALAVRRAAAAALTAVAEGAEGAAGAGMNNRPNDPLPMPEDPLDAEATLRALVPADLPVADRVLAVQKFHAQIAKAGVLALGSTRDRASAVLDALGEGGGQLLPLITRDQAATDPHADARAIDESLEPYIVALVKHPDVEMRMRALAALAHSTSDGAEKARIAALSDESEAVRRVAMGSLGGRASEASAAALSHVLSTDASWAMRVLAAEALGRMGAAKNAGNASETAASTKLAAAALSHAATGDAFALVRESALTALAAIDPTAARPLAKERATNDPEPRVRETATRILRAS